MSNIIQIKRGKGTPPNGSLAPYELGINTDNNELFVGGPLINEGETQKYGAAQGIKVATAINAINAINTDKIKNNNNEYITFADMLNLIYPIGSIYMSVKSDSPETLFGGTWEQIQGRFLLSASDDYESGTEGGYAEVTLTEEQMPSHSHNGIFYTTTGGTTKTIGLNSGSNGYKLSYETNGGNNTSEIFTADSGSGKAHNNMPPYLVVYMWKRIS